MIVKNNCLGMDGGVVIRWRVLYILFLFFRLFGLGGEVRWQICWPAESIAGHVFWRGVIGVAEQRIVFDVFAVDLAHKAC